MSHDEKVSLFQNNKLCFRCTGAHFRSKCTSDVKCDECGKPHITVLHAPDADSLRNATLSTEECKSNLCAKFCNDENESKNCSKVVLVDVTYKNSTKSFICYAIIDEESYGTFADRKVMISSQKANQRAID